MQLQSLKLVAACAPIKLSKSIVFERVKTAKADEPIRITRHLFGNPVVLRPHLRVLVRRPFTDFASEIVRDRENDTALDSCGVQVLNEVLCRECLRNGRASRSKGLDGDSPLSVRPLSQGIKEVGDVFSRCALNDRT